MKRSGKIIPVLMSVLLIGPLVYGQTADQAQRTREFVVMGYQGIQIDLASGKGPYLRTLLDLLNTPDTAETKITDQLKALHKTYPNIMDFADQVVLIGVTTPDAARAVAPVPIPNSPGVYSGEKLVNALEHLTRGMVITVTLKTGEQLKGTFSDYASKRLWILGAARRSIFLDDILALEAPQL